VRTTLEIDDRLIEEAMRSSGAPTHKAAVEAGLRLLVQTNAQTCIRRLRGKIKWDGNLDESRGAHLEITFSREPLRSDGKRANKVRTRT
jgi:Arc/MetJ family transcription regulator